MEHFIEFVHFINSKKNFVFNNIKTFPNSLSKEDYIKLPYDEDKLLKYNGSTFKEFKNYIDTNTDKIKNEILDVFHKSNKEQLKEIHNKLLFLNKHIKQYKTINVEGEIYQIFENMDFTYPDKKVEEFKNLSRNEKSEISSFLKLEFNLVYEYIELMRKLENEFSCKKLILDNSEITGFEFNTTNSIEFQAIYLLLNGSILDCEFETFRNVFGGQKLKSPPKIKWLLKFHKDSYKRALIYFLEHPIFKEISESELIRKIDFCFVNYEGGKMKGRISENYRQYNNDRQRIDSPNNKTKWKELIDEKVTTIQEYLQS